LLSIDEGQFQQLKEVISKTDEVVAILRNEAKSNPVPSIQRGQCFSMIVEDVFQIRGRGICVMGRILDGSVKIGDPVTIDTAGSSVRSSIVAIEKYQQSVKYAVKGETVGLVLSAVSTEHAPAGSLIRSGIA
jgi:translation elongation factor EF-Tu-like GTPase